MKRFAILTLSLIAVAALVAGCGNGKSKKAQAEAAEQARLDSLAKAEQVQKEQTVMEKLASLPEEPVFDIVTSLGTIKVKLYADTPLHRENFAKLAISGYYDGLLFHRVIPDFMIQGGDPLTKDMANADRFGTGGPAYTVPAEFVPEHKHKKGALAAARKGDTANPTKASSGSQFYIVQNAEGTPFLDGRYTDYGETLEGFDVIDKIAAVPTNVKDCPIEPVKIITIKVAE